MAPRLRRHPIQRIKPRSDVPLIPLVPSAVIQVKHGMRWSPFKSEMAAAAIHALTTAENGLLKLLEVETLARDFESKYGVKFASIWHEELSLGELFAKSQPSIHP